MRPFPPPVAGRAERGTRMWSCIIFPCARILTTGNSPWDGRVFMDTSMAPEPRTLPPPIRRRPHARLQVRVSNGGSHGRRGTARRQPRRGRRNSWWRRTGPWRCRPLLRRPPPAWFRTLGTMAAARRQCSAGPITDRLNWRVSFLSGSGAGCQDTFLRLSFSSRIESFYSHVW